MAKEKKSLLTLEINMVCLIFIESIFGLYFTNNIQRFMLGIVIGSIGAFLFLKSLYSSIDISLDLAENDAVKYFKKKAIQRTLLLAGIISGAILLARFISVVSVFISLMNVKFSAYLQPLTNKYVLTKFSEKGR